MGKSPYTAGCVIMCAFAQLGEGEDSLCNNTHEEESEALNSCHKTLVLTQGLGSKADDRLV